MLQLLIYFTGSLVIPANCFKGCQNLKKVMISPSANVVTIGEGAFANCALLDSITFSASTKNISNEAFLGCTSLTSIVLPPELDNLNSGAFSGCKSLVNVHYCGDFQIFDKNPFTGSQKVIVFVKKSYNQKVADDLNLRKVLEENCLLEFKPTYCEPAAKTSNNILPIFLLIEVSLDYTLTTDKKNFTVYGEKEEVTQDIVQKSKYHASYQFAFITTGITGIGESAFSGCTNLQYVSIPSSVRYLDSNCFKACTSLRSIEVPEGVNSIGYQAFWQSGIINISLPGTLTSFNTQAFLDMNSLKQITCNYNELYSTMNDGSLLVYNNTRIVASVFNIKTISIPECIEVLGEYAMNTRSQITSIVFEGTPKLHTIQRSCFRQTGITNIEIPEGVKILGVAIFDRSAVSSVTFPSTLTEVSDYVLQDASKLNSVTGKNSSAIKFGNDGVCYNGEMTMILFMPSDIPSLVIPIGIKEVLPATLIGLTGLTDLSVENNHQKYSAFNNTLYSNTNRTLYSVIGSATYITVHESCESFASNSMKNSKIAHITFLGNSFTTINNIALEGTKQLRVIEFPETLQSIGEWAFYLSGIQEITFPSSLTDLKKHGLRMSSVINVDLSRCTQLKEISTYVFESCQHLKQVLLPEGLNTIANYAFSKCSIKEITIPSTLTKIEDNAFTSSSISSFKYPDNAMLSLIGTYAFSKTNFVTFNLPDSVTEISTSAFEGCTKLEAFICSTDSKLETINNLIFNGVDKMTNVTFGSHLAKIIPGAFTGCSSLISINVPETNMNLSSHGGVLYSKNTDTLIACPCGLSNVTVLASASEIADSGFFNCSKAVSITFDTGSLLAQIGYSTFYGCTSLTSIVMPSGLKKLLDSCFTGCEKLTTVEFEDGCIVESIGKAAFSSCTKLNELDFSKCMHLKDLGEESFSGCNNLQKVTLPSSLENLGSKCFASCSNLVKVIYCSKEIPESATLWPSDVFTGSNEQLTVIVPYFYSLKSFCGAKISFQLDADCNYATAAFTDSIDNNVSSLLLAIVVTADFEGE